MPAKGWFTLGVHVPLSVTTRDSNGTAALPAKAPGASVYNSSGTLVLSFLVPIKNRYEQTAYFYHPLFLDSRFSTGAHSVIYAWTISGTAYVSQDTFEVVAGGDDDGSLLAMHFYDQPVQDYLLAQTDAGLLLRLRNPRLP